MPVKTPSTTDQLKLIETQLDQLALQNQSWIDAHIGSFRSALSDIADEWQDHIIAAVANPALANPGQVKNILYMQGEIRKQLNDLGYAQLSSQFVNSFDTTKQNTLDMLGALQISITRLAPFDETALQTLKNTNLDWLNHLGTTAIASVTRGLVQSVVAGTPRKSMIENIRSAVDSNLKGYAGTYADTALSSYDRVAHWQAFDHVGIQDFIYRGPLDIKTRPFCRKLVGKSFTRKQIDAMNNGTRLQPVSKFGGGWNCRHFFIPSPQIHVFAPDEQQQIVAAPTKKQIPAREPALDISPRPLQQVLGELSDAKALRHNAKQIRLSLPSLPVKTISPEQAQTNVLNVQERLKQLAGEVRQQLKLKSAAAKPAAKSEPVATASKALRNTKALAARVQRASESATQLKLRGDVQAHLRATENLQILQGRLTDRRADLSRQFDALLAESTRQLDAARLAGDPKRTTAILKRIDQLRRQYTPYL